MVLEMGLAESVPDREAVFRFWYSVYVEEMGRHRDAADHARRELRGVEDETAYIFMARDQGEVVAACRWSWGGDGFSDRQIEQYQLDSFLAEVPAERMSIGERTMVAASHRGGTAYIDLAYQVTPFAERHRALLSFGASEPHLVSYYARFGQRPFASRQHFSEESGYIIPTLSIPFGLDGLGEPTPDCVRRAALGSPAVHNAEVDGDESFEDAIRTARRATEAGVPAGLSHDDVMVLARRGTLLRCRGGDQILRQGGTARNPFVVMSGSLEVRDHTGTARDDWPRRPVR